jgi:hypothetical protein
MMGWLILAALLLVTGAALVLLRVPRLLWSLVGAALMLGAAGYAWQGRPGLSGHPADPGAAGLGVDPALIDIRTQMFGRYGSDGAYLVAADALARSGSPEYEVQAILGGIRQSPGSVALWTSLGDALARHDGGRLSAPAQFAFDRAARLDPRHPGPPFFRGLAQVRGEDYAAAAASWHRALALTPPGASYRDAIAQRVMLLDRLRAMMDRGTPPAAVAQPAR